MYAFHRYQEMSRAIAYIPVPAINNDIISFGSLRNDTDSLSR